MAMTPLVLTLWIGATLAADEPQSFPVGPGGKLFGVPDIEVLLARPYAPDVPMACTGERLWAAHPAGWAFPQGVHHYLRTARPFGIDLQITLDGQQLEPADATCFPSHVRMTNRTNELEIDGAKWITADDVMAVQIRITNTASKSQKLVLQAGLPPDVESAPSLEDTVHGSFEQSGMTVHNLYFIPGFKRVRENRQTAAAYYVEGERPARQTGSEGSDYKEAASGGEVLGSQFGGDAGDWAEWRIDVGGRPIDATLSIRYARADAGSTDFTVDANGKQQECKFESTGGWGFAQKDFRVVSIPLGRVKGNQLVRIKAKADRSNLNVDAVCIHANDVEPRFGGPTHARFLREISLKPGETRSIRLFQSVGVRVENAETALARLITHNDPLPNQVETYKKWLTENVPVFVSDEALTKQYWHRATSVLKKNLFRVGEGRLARWSVSEGRWDSGWYPNVISYGGGHQIRECRWLREPQYVRDVITTWCENEKPNGVFPNFIRPDAIGTGQYTDWITSAVWDAYCVEPQPDLLPQWAGALQKNVDGWLATYDADNDGLLLVDSHWWTGMEWQPSFFYFNGFDRDKQDQQLERVDLTAYVYGNAAHLALLLDAMGDSANAQRYRDIAAKIRDACLSVMWHADDRYFYSVDPTSHEKALVKEVIGVYPYYFGMPPQDAAYLDVWKSLLDPAQFWTDWPVASASKQCPAYSQDITFNGKDVGGCMWNGPTWPHANSIVLSAMAHTLRDYPACSLTAGHLYELFQSFTMAQFKNQNLLYPWTGEYYNGNTAEWRTAERDYYHSTYNDILIADIAGLRPRLDNVLEIHPIISEAMPDFLLDGVRYHGHDITIAWNRGDTTSSPDALAGFRVYVDGKRVHHATSPAPIALPNYGLK